MSRYITDVSSQPRSHRNSCMESTDVGDVYIYSTFSMFSHVIIDNIRHHLIHLCGKVCALAISIGISVFEVSCSNTLI